MLSLVARRHSEIRSTWAEVVALLVWRVTSCDADSDAVYRCVGA